MNNFKQILILVFSIIVIGAVSISNNFIPEKPNKFYVDPKNGNDSNNGSMNEPFKTIQYALNVVSNRVENGIRSDKIFLRAGVYKSINSSTLYKLNLKGTPSDYALLSAMPCAPGDPNGVKRKSGSWYEKVVFDDGYVINSPWKRRSNDSKVWVTEPGFCHLEWVHTNLWPWRWITETIKLTPNDETPTTTSFTVAPYMLLQDGEPTIWVESAINITEPGMRFYDNVTRKLYLRPFDDKDPNKLKIETWYGGPKDYDIGMLHLDGEGRALFDGSLEYTAIRGFEFRMFTNLFEFHRRGYKKESDRVIQKYVRFEDNLCEYGWMHILLDANTILMDDTLNLFRPRYKDRSNWEVRNNVFYRPSREVCQLHGDDHVFEYNEIIDHIGPWAGPAACVSVINTRNTRNMKIRYNYIRGNGNTKWNQGSVFMIEVEGDPHVDQNGDYIYGGQTYEYNIIADISRGPIMFLGKGNARMKDITIRNNIFYNSQEDAAILISSPQKNLKIENNVFYDQVQPIKIKGDEPLLMSLDLPSSISICGNIFMNNEGLIDSNLFRSPKNSKIVIDNNVFYQNKCKALGTNSIFTNPLFLDPQNFDFRCKQGSSVRMPGHDIGVYDDEIPLTPGIEWWKIKENALDILYPYSAIQTEEKIQSSLLRD